MRQIALDTETTGINKFSGPHYKGHRIIEIGAVEIINRRITGKIFHTYINPKRKNDLEAFNIHGISDEFLSNQPVFSDIINDFIQFIDGSELIIHNAKFDIGFINYELNMLDNNYINDINSICNIIDTLFLARKKFPGRRNSLTALCERYSVNKNERILHNAIIDAKILASVYLLMTGGQKIMQFMQEDKSMLFVAKNKSNMIIKQLRNANHYINLKVIFANKNEIIQHKKILSIIKNKYGYCMWHKMLKSDKKCHSE